MQGYGGLHCFVSWHYRCPDPVLEVSIRSVCGMVLVTGVTAAVMGIGRGMVGSHIMKWYVKMSIQLCKAWGVGPGVARGVGGIGL